MSIKKNKKRVLFILKKRENYGCSNKTSYGLLNSCNFVKKALEKEGVECIIRETFDGNTIDKEVFETNPNYVFLEAIWAPPDKIRELLSLKRYKNIKWFVRIHSKVEFLAHEGMAFTWLLEYAKIAKEFKNFKIAFNSEQPIKDFENSLGINAAYAPNIYPFKKVNHPTNHTDKLKIGCFGAIRELKNHLNQAFGVLDFARNCGLTIEFHVNSSLKYEKYGDNILKNLTALFASTKHKLVIHEWMAHDEFLKVVKKMDICSQVSYSETCNITLIDSVALNIPSIGSKEIPYIHKWYVADPADSHDIAKKLEFAHFSSFLNLHRLNERGLSKYNDKSIRAWLKIVG